MRIAFTPQVKSNINFNSVTPKKLNNQSNTAFGSKGGISKDDYLVVSGQKDRYVNMSVDEAIDDLRKNYSKAKYPENAFSNVVACMLDRLSNDADSLVRFTKLNTELNPKVDNHLAQISLLTRNSEPYVGSEGFKPAPMIIEKLPLSTLLDFSEKADMSPETTMRVLLLNSYDSENKTWNKPYFIEKYNAGGQDKDSANRIFALAEKVIKGYLIPTADGKIAQAERIRTGEEQVYMINRMLPGGIRDYRTSAPELGKFSDESIKFFDTYSSFIPEEKAEEFEQIKTYFQELSEKYKGI